MLSDSERNTIHQQLKKLRTAFRVGESYLKSYEANEEQVIKLINVLHEARAALLNTVNCLVDTHSLPDGLRTSPPNTKQ